MFLQAEAGTERWVQWGRRMGARLDQARRMLGLEAMAKAYTPEPGTLVWVKATPNGVSVRVSGGAAGDGRTIRSTMGAPSISVPPRLYLVRSGQLAVYGESDFTSDANPRMSTNGRTVSFQRLAGAYSLKRNLRARQELVGSWAGLPRDHDNQNESTSQLDPRGSADGKVFVTVSASLPNVYRLSAAQEAQDLLPRASWTGATSFDLAASGAPPGITSFLASQPCAQSVNWATGDLTATVPADPFTGEASYSATVMSSLSTASVAFDPYLDAPVAVFTTPYINRVTNRAAVAGIVINGAVELYFSLRVQMYWWDRSSSSWLALRDYDFADVWYRRSLSATSGPGHSLEASIKLPASATAPGVEASSYVASGHGDASDLVWLRPNYARATPSSDTRGYSVVGALSVAAGTTDVMRGTSALASLPAATTTAPFLGPALAAFSLDGYLGVGETALFGDTPSEHWFVRASPGAYTDMSFAQGVSTFMSPTGHALWTNDAAAHAANYYEYGSLRFTQTDFSAAAAIAANGTTYALYSTPPAQGFFYFRETPLWSFDSDRAFKASVFEKVTQTVTPPPYATFEDLVRAVMAAGGLSHADAVALLASGGIDETNYLSFFPGSTSYAAVTSTRLLRWSESLGYFQTLKVYSTTIISLASRDGLTETVPGATPVHTSNAQLTQDEFLPH